MTTRRTVVAACLGFLAWCGFAATAMAQDSVASEALFNRGIADMEAGKFDSACPAIAESQRLEARPGTLYTLAECEAKWGRIASAVAHYSEYLGLVSRMPAADNARHRDRAKASKEQIDRLRPQVPQLTLVLPAGAPKEVVVKRDGVTLSGASLGVALPVDPGEHLVATQVPGGPEHEQKIVVGLRESKRVEIEIELPKSVAVTPPSVNTVAQPAEPGTPPAPRSGAAPDHTWAYVAGGIGAAGIVVGAVTGILSMNKKKTVDDNCQGNVCNDKGLAAADDGKMLGNVSSVGFGVGIAGLATGVVLWLAAPQGKAPEQPARRWSATVGTAGGAPLVGVAGRW